MQTQLPLPWNKKKQKSHLSSTAKAPDRETTPEFGPNVNAMTTMKKSGSRHCSHNLQMFGIVLPLALLEKDQTVLALMMNYLEIMTGALILHVANK